MIPAAGYRIVKTNGGETLSDIAAREGIPYSKGSGFYQLQKVRHGYESISYLHTRERASLLIRS